MSEVVKRKAPELVSGRIKRPRAQRGFHFMSATFAARSSEIPGQPAARQICRPKTCQSGVGNDLVADLLAFTQLPSPARSTALMCTNTSLPPSSG